ncbi:DNA polymerase III subunit gamma/tau [Rickettsiales endosymbiont of Stachyamoeba lipophora]|uniref:DNA polymerase III subunit gamma/tau n=1 Tax=Rickettsiales endosymbiont of Stachyamoeba lipophora TaxID=2486578 RepID=UPI000F65064F|nr:DNA polymerase III subunit gamma/tau [Rickettsiales endosymbiont of Stachyamoeba lipophora]AZL16225.1 DNA polymerase III subunit gamma/tau [Rickettsiales endosymbiont of Stachyamoeba lipophora]
MSENYLALARKYRPLNFDDLVGQESIVTFFKNAFDSNRIHHAYLFTGIRGVGKTTTARIIAKSLNCIGNDDNHQPTIKICGECIHCKSVVEDRHVDVLEMDAASKTSIEDVKDIIEFTKYLPVSSRYKVIIIDEVHMLSTKAFNALLKTLEEPPSRVIFIFATTEIRKVPITILSRCQRFDLRRLTTGELTSHLSNICNKEQVAFELSALEIIAHSSEGSVRDSLSILDQAINISYAINQTLVTEEIVIKLLGRADYNNIFELFQCLVEANIEAVIAKLRDFHNLGCDTKFLIETLMSFVHYLMLLKSTKLSDQNFFLSQEKLTKLNLLAEKLSVPVLSRLWSMLLKGLEEIRSCPQELMALEVLMIRICHVKVYPTSIDMLNGGEEGGGDTTSQVNLVAKDNKQANMNFMLAPKLESIAKEQVKFNNLLEIIQYLRNKNEMVIAFQLERYASLVSLHNEYLEVNITADFDNNTISKLKQKLLEYTGNPWQVVCSEAQGDKTVYEQKQLNFYKQVADIKEHPKLLKLFKNFPNAEVISIKDLNTTH